MSNKKYNTSVGVSNGRKGYTIGFLKLKKWLKSKSINFALIMGSLGVVESYTGEIKDKLGDSYGLAYAIVFSIGMIYLRSITTTSLKDK